MQLSCGNGSGCCRGLLAAPGGCWIQQGALVPTSGGSMSLSVSKLVSESVSEPASVSVRRSRGLGRMDRNLSGAGHLATCAAGWCAANLRQCNGQCWSLAWVHDLIHRPQTSPHSHKHMHGADNMYSWLTLVTSCRKVLCTGSISRRGTLVLMALRFHRSDMPIGSSTKMLRYLQVVVQRVMSRADKPCANPLHRGTPIGTPDVNAPAVVDSPLAHCCKPAPCC
jgi:hypothetical protein